ncbi:DUF29 domain-containing protein [Spirosoma montaniterrae]|uniref:DUF29 domain-containing protein n=1 Tax=Spirosoma montaniterrae TaxID=1178516 RepID=A0A1P9WVE6_9BACT|nr:DUF29 domain-containing protein [Spirosoma montaniterrae]AQG79344.1 hypothetical protein AWR27_08440 [Spirosoma montaniterrae]
MKNWEDITSTSELLAAQEIKQSFDAGDLADVEYGLNQLIETMARSERRALKSQLIRLMMHVIKWKVQPEKRSKSWLLTILNARFEIAELREFTPSLNEDVIQAIWEAALKQARTEANIDTDLPTNHVELTWEDVFDTKYTL